MPKIDFRQIGDPLDVEHVKAIFDEIGLVLGGLVAIELPTVDPEMDTFIWKLCQSLDAIRNRAVRKLEPQMRPTHDKRLNLKPHPAIWHLLNPRERYEEP